jgi:hypothetical protein
VFIGKYCFGTKSNTTPSNALSDVVSGQYKNSTLNVHLAQHRDFKTPLHESALFKSASFWKGTEGRTNPELDAITYRIYLLIVIEKVMSHVC